MNTTEENKAPLRIRLRHDFKPGDIGRLVYLHGTLYAEEFGWDHTFEAYVAGPLAEFAKSHNNRERIWIVETDQQVFGSIAIVEASAQEAQLRWLLLHPELRGQGVGRMLGEEAINFCRASGYRAIFLWTVSELKAAASLYRSLGFQLTEENTHRMWGATITEQRYELRF
ncbi:MAG TPA: GNAT family N-acetyltransferase [Blastocatellia bacterium]|nr:GNAT family N-acetyltransferase [Blastocatellia bacterium]